MTAPSPAPSVAVIGGGPAGLMAAETMAGAGLAVTVFERMPNPGRKLLMAGRGGLNISHTEDFVRFVARYRAAAPWLRPMLAAFGPAEVAAWCEGLGQAVFTGSSGRVFPVAMKASPLLRAWLARLDGMGVRLETRAEWRGWDTEGRLVFADGRARAADATVLALGGASWPRLGADGGWVALMPEGSVAPLVPANCGFVVRWSAPFLARHAGAPLKRIALRFGTETVRGEAVVAAQGIEGGVVYALSAPLREAIARDGHAMLRVDLRPDLEASALAKRLAAPRGSASLSSFLRKQAALSPVAVGLVQEALHAGDSRSLGEVIKDVALRLEAPFGLERAISTAGGLRLAALDERLMLNNRPGVFAAGEMLDWEAPTGGYLLTACLATGAAAGRGVVEWLAAQAAGWKT